ncbi:MAG: sigma-70 family RNA polymerase sigma factor [Planctomycetes bacterium]|nr:sigma-70 family RNA polymerase sigma factor [Planctomycetota bacterium]
MEDKLLVLKCKRGSPDALGRIYQKYKADLLVLAMVLLNDKSAAEDVLQDVFLSFVQSLEKFRLTGSLKGYLLTCVANRARNSNKAKHHQGVGLDQAGPFCSDSDEPTNSIICNEQLQQLSSAMAQLPYDQREVVLLHHQAKMTFKTIAKSQGISVNTAKSRYRYGLDKLRLILDEVKK